eukprot:Gb_20243 [translate_table: standard]
MGKCKVITKATKTSYKPTNINIREYDELELRDALQAMALDHPNYVTLEKAGLRSYFLLAKLFYEDHSITEAIAFTTRHPELLQIVDEVVHEVMGLPFDGLDIPKGSRASRVEVAKEFCICAKDFSKSSIPLNKLKDDNMCWIAKLIAVKLFGLQRYMYVPTHLLTTIFEVATGKRFNWSSYIKLCLQRMLVNVGATTKQASFFMPSVFTALLLNWFNATRLPILQGIPKIPRMIAWCTMYGQGIFPNQQVEVIMEKLNVAVSLLNAECGDGSITTRKKNSVTKPPYGQGEEPREDREVGVESERKRKGKATVQVESKKT